MAYCTKCGTELDEKGVCPNCPPKENAADKINKGVKKLSDSFKNAEDTTADYEKKDIEKNLFFAIISYFGILILLPIIVVPDSKFVRFHTSQALNLMILRFIYYIVSAVLILIFVNVSKVATIIIAGLLALLGIGIFAIWIQGIANAAGKRAKKLPFVGKFDILD